MSYELTDEKTSRIIWDAVIKQSVLRAVIKVVPEVVPYLDAATIKAAVGTYSGVRDKYYGDVFASVYDFLDTGKRMTSFKNDMRRGMADAFVSAGDIAWSDGGADLPLDEDALAWLATQQQAEFGFIDVLFGNLKELRKTEDVDKTATATARAEGYCQKLDYVYTAIKMMAKKNQMLTWRLGNTERHCSTCSQLDGKSHRASWYIAHDYIPRKPGASMDCGGWNCDCSLLTKSGEVFTIGIE